MTRLGSIVALVLSVATADVGACPPGPCLKHRHMVQVRATATVYVRADRARLPGSDPRAIAEFLTRSTWLPPETLTPPGGPLPPLPMRFVAPRQASRRGDVRVVLLRRIEHRHGVAMVEVDGQVFALDRCRDAAQRWTACLELRTDLSFDEPEREGNFAQPPGR